MRRLRYPNGHWTPEQYRRRYLPGQLEAARRKVEMLEREAARLGIEVTQ